MSQQTLYSLRTDGDNYRITKFVDGDVESSYLTTVHECECPAGHRPSCRHRQMLPNMLAHGIANTHWFWNFDTNRVVDFNGELKSNIDAMNELAAKPHSTSDELAEEVDLSDPVPQYEEPEGLDEDDSEQLPDGVERDNALAVDEAQHIEEDTGHHLIADLPPEHSAHSGDVIGRMTGSIKPGWRRL